MAFDKGITGDLVEARFRGLPLLVTRTSVVGGLKYARHTFVNNANQNIEKLGNLQRSYTLQVIISGGPDDTLYKQRKNQLLALLEQENQQPNTGTLVHPIDGAIENMVAVGWGPLVENFNHLGDAMLPITFEKSFDKAVPQETATTLGAINQAVQDTAAKMEENIADDYSVTDKFVGNFQAATDKANGVVDAMNENTAFLAQTADAVNAVSSGISEFANNITTLVQNPTALATSINNLFSTVNGAYISVTATFDVMKQFFSFGDNDITINPTTAGLAERKINNDLINQQIQIGALSHAYLNAAQIDFGTVNNLEEAANELEAQFNKIINSDGMDQNTKGTLIDLRSITERFFDLQKVNLNQIITVFTPKTSVRLLSYQYYGESITGPTLAKLNNEADVSFIEGDVEVLTE